ncbi:MAG: DUF6390 family protein [bacterium]
MDGVARCSRYSLGPNRLHLCGPDLNREVLSYINENISDDGLISILKQFKTLYPYLQQIAHANQIKDPFDPRVVEAYWIGNSLLDTITAKIYYRHLTDNVQVQKMSSSKQVDKLKDKLAQGALMHHSFHVLNIWRRTGHHDIEHTPDTIDKCCVTWGKILKVSGPTLIVSRQPIFGPPKKQKIIRQLEHASLLDDVKAGDYISIHWDTPCEIITPKQAANLTKYTRLSINLANQTLTHQTSI